MEKFKRIIALAGAVFLVLLYVMTFISAINATPDSTEWFAASIGATVIIPIFIYAFALITRVTKRHEEDSELREKAFLRQMKEQAEQNKEQAADEDSNQ